MKCGGSVSAAVKKCGGGMTKGKYKEGGNVDLKQDKALIKKAFTQHDKAEHDKSPTEIKLKKGGRSKKEVGSVKKFKVGGAIEMKKSSGDIDTIKKIKATGAKKADAPSKAAIAPKNTPKKFAIGGLTSPVANAGNMAPPPAGLGGNMTPMNPNLNPANNSFGNQGGFGMADGGAVDPQQAIAVAQKLKERLPPEVIQKLHQQMQMGLQKAGMGQGAMTDRDRLVSMGQGQGIAPQQAGNPNAMNTTFNANQPPAYPSASNDVMNNQYSRSGLNNKAVDSLLGSMKNRGDFSHTGD